MDQCENCKYYDVDDGYCTAMVCTPISCDEPLPCECGETDAVTLYAERGNYETNIDDFDDVIFDNDV